MRRLLAGIVAIAVIGVVIAEHGSSVASARRAHGSPPTLKRLLRSEIATLRAEQPSAAPRGRRAIAPGSTAPALPAVPEQGGSCFVAGGSSRCSEVPCQVFAAAPAVYRPTSIEVVPAGPSRSVKAPALSPQSGTSGQTAAPACRRHAPPARILVSEP